jgi:hypothetical protein
MRTHYQSIRCFLLLLTTAIIVISGASIAQASSSNEQLAIFAAPEMTFSQLTATPSTTTATTVNSIVRAHDQQSFFVLNSINKNGVESNEDDASEKESSSLEDIHPQHLAIELGFSTLLRSLSDRLYLTQHRLVI